VSLDQSLWARIFGYGRVVVTGTGDAVIMFPAMAHPVDFRRAIEAARADCGGEVHLGADDRQALERAAHPNDDVANANEPDEEEKPRRKRSSFIGLRPRR
jgi:hypothetical protein